MKILYISYAKPDSGAGVHTEGFFQALRNINNTSKFHPCRSMPLQEASLLGSLTSGRKTSPLREPRMLAAMFTRRFIEELNVIRKYSPDAVVLRAGIYFSSLLICRLMKIPIVLEINGPVYEHRLIGDRQRLRWIRFYEWLEINLLIELSRHVIVVSEPLRRHYITRGVSPNKISTVPNGVDLDAFRPEIDGSAVRRAFGVEGHIVIGLSGSFAPWHGLDFLFESAIPLIRERRAAGCPVSLMLIGSPKPYLGMSEIAEEFVISTGYLPHARMPAYLAALDIFVAPYPPIDPFYFSPLKIFEAMAQGKPVITSAQGQIREVIKDGTTGFLFTAGDYSGFIRKLKKLMDDANLRASIGKAARKAIENGYTWEDNAKRVLKVCQALYRN